MAPASCSSASQWSGRASGLSHRNPDSSHRILARTTPTGVASSYPNSVPQQSQISKLGEPPSSPHGAVSCRRPQTRQFILASLIIEIVRIRRISVFLRVRPEVGSRDTCWTQDAELVRSRIVTNHISALAGSAQNIGVAGAKKRRGRLYIFLRILQVRKFRLMGIPMPISVLRRSLSSGRTPEGTVMNEDWSFSGKNIIGVIAEALRPRAVALGDESSSCHAVGR
jgi:hypothetical protein